MADSAVVTENVSRDQNVVGSITTSDGFTIDSNFETSDALASAIPPAEPEVIANAAAPTETAPPRRRNRRDDPTVAVAAAVGKQREAERVAKETADRIAALEEENAELKKPKPAPVAAPAPVVQPPPAVAAPATPVTEAAYKRYQAMPDAPKIDTFQTIEEYQFAVSHFIAQKMFSENMQRMSEGARISKEREKFTTRIAAETEKDPTFSQRLNSVPIDTRIIPWLHAHPMGDEVMVHLVNNPQLAQHITTLPPIDQIGQIGELVATLKAQSAAALPPASARPAISQAKPPTKRVSGQPPAATDEPPDDDASEAQHEAYWGPRRQEIRSARRAHR